MVMVMTSGPVALHKLEKCRRRAVLVGTDQILGQHRIRLQFHCLFKHRGAQDADDLEVKRLALGTKDASWVL